MAWYPHSRRRANREGTIYHVPSENRWRAALTWTDAAGKRHRRIVSGRTQAAVRQRLGALRSELDHGLAPVRTGTLAGYLAGWLEREKQRIRPSTWRGRDHHVRAYLAPALGPISLDKLTPAHVERMTADLVASGRSPRTARHARVTLRRALADAVRDGLVHRNVAALARPPRVTRRTIEPGRDYLDTAQLRRLLAVAVEYRVGGARHRGRHDRPTARRAARPVVGRHRLVRWRVDQPMVNSIVPSSPARRPPEKQRLTKTYPTCILPESKART